MTRRTILAAIPGSVLPKFRSRNTAEHLASAPIRYGVEAAPASLVDLQSKVGTGWAKIIERLVADLFALGWDGEVLQVKEKFGGLRFYINAQTDEMRERRDQATDESFRTCEECGAAGMVREERK